MLNTLTQATFQYRGRYITARRMVDKISGKFFCWQGDLLGCEDFCVVAKTIQQFEKQFIALVDKISAPDDEAEPLED